MKLRLIIDYDQQTESIELEGPVHSKAACYVILELAKDAVRDHIAKASGGIVAASAADVPKITIGRANGG